MSGKKNPVIYLTGKLWQHSVGNRKNIAIYFSMFFIANAVSLTQPLIVAGLLNELQSHGLSKENLGYLLFLSFLFLARGLLFWLFHGPARVIENKNAFMACNNYRRYLLGGVLLLPLSWHNEHHSGDTIDKVQKGASGLYGFGAESFRIIVVSQFFIGSFLALMFFDVGASLIVLIMMALTIWMIALFDKKIEAQYNRLNKHYNGISEKIVDVITNVTTVVILRIEKLLLRSIANKMTEPFGLYHQNSKLNELKWFLVSVIAKTMVFLVLGYHLCSHVYWGLPLAIGTFFALYGYATSVEEAFFDLAGIYGRILQSSTEVANAEELAKEFKASPASDGNDNVLPWEELRVEGLNFSYRGEVDENLHLENISLKIKRGEKVAFVGATGSGKTTLLKVIRELYTPETGQVFLDGVRLPGGFNAISKEITLIPQEPEIFATNILDNITLGAEYDMEKVREHANLACFAEVAERLPNKLNSSLMEKGVNLSGGEKQRLALTRGLLASEGKSIVLLDEPTSSIDVANELKIYQNIFKAFADKAIISSIHRLHLLPMFDCVYLFDSGRIIASGTFEELTRTSKEFQELMSGYQGIVKDL